MIQKNLKDKIIDFFKNIYRQLFLIDDSAQRVALGFGLGVFLGIFPGAGPIASIVLAAIFKVNRASALIGCLLTNTWISVITFLLSIKAGAVIMGLDWRQVYQQCALYFKNFRFVDLLKTSALKIVAPVMLGYILIGIIFGVIAYLIILTALKLFKRKGGGYGKESKD